MSDIGSLRRSGGSLLPSIRKSSDPFQPEMGQMDFSQEMDEVNAVFTTAVQETEKTEQNVITDENRRKQYRFRKPKRKKEDEEKNQSQEEELFVDLTA